MNHAAQTPAVALAEIVSRLPEGEQRSLLSYAITYARIWYPAALISAPKPQAQAPKRTKRKPARVKTIHDDLADVILLSERRPGGGP